MSKWVKQKKVYFSLAAFLIPVIIMLFVSVLEGFYPFGSVSILVADMKYQFVDYIGYMKSIFYGNNDFLYSFSKTFGGDMTGFSAYYLFNPFFLILLFFPNSELPAGILIIVILMAGCSGLTFHYLLREVYEDRFASLIFSTAYALMGYYVAYVNCIQYFFDIVMFPLVILGLYRTYRTRRVSLLYIISVAVSIITNYYIGYMILIYTAVYFVLMFINDTNSVSEFKSRIKNIWIVLYSTVLGILISGASLVSVVYSLRGQKSSGLLLSLSRNFRITEFFSGLYTNAFHGNISNGLPIIYSGIIPVIFLFFYFLNKNVKIKEKILCALLFLFIIAGFWIDALNVAWHGFAHPIGFPYRNSFIFSFTVLFFGYKGFLTLKSGFKMRNANILIIIFALYSAFLIISGSEYVTLRQVAVTGVFVVMSLICIIMLNEGRKYVVPAIVGIIILQCADLGYNAFYSMDAYFGDRYSYDNSEEEFANTTNELLEIVNLINEQDESFFRMDKLYRRTHNDALMAAYNGLSHFSSCERDSVKRFMGKMGYRDNGNWAFYSQGSTALSESFMGLKYLVSQYDETSKPYDRFTTVNDKYIYKNPYALSLGFGMNSKVQNINTEVKDPFILQNNIASSFSDNKYEPYRKVEQNDLVLSNVSQNGNTFSKINSDEEAYIEYVLKADSNDFIFMYFDAPELQNTELYVNNAWKEPCFTMYDWCIRECGHFEPGEEVSIKICLLQNDIKIDNAYFYYEDKEVIKDWYADASKNTVNIQKISSSHLIADTEITPDTDILVFSIPYEKDWLVTVDGNRVETVPVMDSLLAINIENGKHIIELRYIPRGLVIGSIISIIGIIATFCVILLCKIQNKRDKNFFKK